MTDEAAITIPTLTSEQCKEIDVQDAVEQFTVGDLVVRVVYDEDGEAGNPREGDNLAEIVCDHRRYTIGDRKPNPDEVNAIERGGWKLLKRWLELHGAIAFTKIGMYDHSGITIYPVGLESRGAHIFDSAGWDSGIVGFAYITRKRWAELMGDTPIAAENADEHLEGEIKNLDTYLRGEVYGYTVTRPHAECGDWKCPHSEVLDSCWGYLGDPDYVATEARSSAEWDNAHPETPAE
jgi:hypothetical protein